MSGEHRIPALSEGYMRGVPACSPRGSHTAVRCVTVWAEKKATRKKRPKKSQNKHISYLALEEGVEQVA